MKKSLFLLLHTFLIVVVFSGCSDDDAPTTNNAIMTAEIDGTPWEAVIPGASYIQERLGIAGTYAADETIVISLDLPTLTAESFDLDQNSTSAIALTLATGEVAFTSNGSTTAGGPVVITDVDTENMLVSGTFASLCVRAIDNEEVNITNGVFTNVPYTDTLPTNDNTFRVDIDGTNWQATNVTGSVAFGMLTINATNADVTRTVGLSLPDDVTPGTYSLDLAGDFTALYNVDDPTLVIHAASSGTVVISSHDVATRTIAGTFEFEAVENFGLGPSMASLTNGEFSLSY